MSITAMPTLKFLTVAESSLLSQPSLFFSCKTKYPFASNSLKPFKLQNPSSNFSSFSPSLSTHHSPLLTFVAQTSDFAQQEAEEEDGAAWENEGEPTWGNEDADESEGGEDGTTTNFAEPSEELKIFVGNLPWDVDSEKLGSIFEEAGSVQFAEVIYNRATSRSRGFGFVVMTTAEGVENALNKFSGYELDGRVLTVNKASPREERSEQRPPPQHTFDSGSGLSVYVGNLPWDVDNVRLEQIFSEHGQVENARIVYDRETGRSRGFGFVTLSTEAEINDAISALDGQDLDGRTIRVSVAEGRSRRSSF